MQTDTTKDDPKATPAQLLKREQDAERKLAKLRDEEQRRTEEAARASVAFEKEPTKQSATDKMVADQLRANAERDRLAFENSDEFAEARSAAQRVRDVAQLEELRTEFANWNSLVASERDAIAAALATCIETVREQCKSIQSKLTARQEVLTTMNGLSRRVGDGTQYPHVSFASAVHWVDGAVRDSVATHPELHGSSGIPIVLRAQTRTTLGDFMHVEHRWPIENLAQNIAAPLNPHNVAR